MEPNYSGYDLSQDHPGYSLPRSNITYHVYPERSHTENEIVSQNAYRRIMDSYEEYEKLADIFQVELDKRQQEAKERKTHEKLLREERQRQLREERRNRGTAKSKATLTPTTTPSRGSPQPYHPYKIPNQKISLTDPRRGPSALNHSDRYLQLQGSIFCVPSDSNSHDERDQQPNLIHDSSHPNKRSISSSPILPLTPSPPLQPSNLYASLATEACSTPYVPTGSMSPFATSLHSFGQEQATTSLRKKRKQAIPVRSSVINRTPGITLKIQPDNDQNLRVEILKNIEDYQQTQLAETKVDAISDGDVHMGQQASAEKSSDSNVDVSESQKKLQVKQDLDKIRESIESARPGYAFYPSSITEVTEFQRSGSSPNISPKHRRYSFSTLESSASMVPLSELDVLIAARADLPLSWNNFSNRECQVNKVVGKHDSDFELLEMTVQEAVARQHAAHVYPSSDDESSISRTGPVKAQGRRSSHLAQDREQRREREDSAATDQSTPLAESPTKKAKSDKHSRKSSVSPIQKPLVSTARHATGARSTRGGDANLVPVHDDIEKAMKEKRLKKLAEKKRQESLSRMTSESVTDGGHETDDEHVEHEDNALCEDVALEESHSVIVKSEDDVTQNLGRSLPKVSPLGPRKSLTLSIDGLLKCKDHESPHSQLHSQPNSPPSPPHSRHTSPARVASGISQSGKAATESDPSSTPPTTPLFAPMTADHHLSIDTQQEPVRSSISTTTTSTSAMIVPSGVRVRTRVRSDSTPVPPEGRNIFFDSALEKIAAKRREQIAKKKAANARATSTDHEVHEGKVNNDNDKESPEQFQKDSDALITLDSHALERGMHGQEFNGVKSSAANLPKSSKFLPGRVLRKTRAKSQDVSGGQSSSATTSISGSAEQHSNEGVNDMDMIDPDCTSCRLVLNSLDRLLWKQAMESGDIHLNPRTWSKTAALCVACKAQYQKHHMRCTQCFYVPVLTDDMSRVGGLKAGGTCSRCKAGTWHRDSDSS
ncbi:hypothetical protein BGZ46_001651 [Entomortierella lignicola]|nr:hypothetical protein BGZ46_001651 [Entomortierella lignicola]